MKNITLSADEQLIRKARQRASRQGTTLNAEFRKWLKWYTNENKRTLDFMELMSELSYVEPGRRYRRDELNER